MLQLEESIYKIFLQLFAVECNFSCSYDSYWHVLCSKRFVRDNLQCWVDRDINLGRYKPIFIFQFVVSTTLNAQNVERNSVLAIIYHSSLKTYREAESSKSVSIILFSSCKKEMKTNNCQVCVKQVHTHDLKHWPTVS